MEKKSEKAIKLEVEKILEQVKLLREEAKQEGLSFESLSEKELIKKERGETSESPYAYSHSWSNPVPRGVSGLYRMYIRNPDTYNHYWLHVSIFFGLCFLTEDFSQAWIGRDTNWPTLSTPQFSMMAESYTSKTLYYVAPSNVPASTYHINPIFWKQIHPHGNIYYKGGFSVNIT